MKTQLFNLSDCIGKTISKISDEDEDYIVIVFTDDTFIHLETDYDTSVISHSSPFYQEPYIHNYKELFELGFIDNSQVLYFENLIIKERKNRELRVKKHELK